MSDSPEIRLARTDERGQILRFVETMGFNPRDQETWDGLGMLAMSAWRAGELIGVIPIEPRPLRVATGRTARCAHETVVAVHPAHRAQGIGSAMQAQLLESLRGRAQFLSVFREEPDSAAYRWYVQNGFQPAMHVDSWFCEPQDSARAESAVDVFDVADERTPWELVESIWRAARESGGGFVDRGERPLKRWLAVHPYRHRYTFTLVVERRGRASAYALCGVGSMHSDSPRLDILELCSTVDADGTARLLDGVLQHARSINCTATRWPLAVHDPNVQVAREAGFVNKWGFDMLVRPLTDEVDLNPQVTSTWRYAGVDYI
jgi:GNAT superfamily N-acetyltransferase